MCTWIDIQDIQEKKWQYFTANVKHRQPSITFQNAGSSPVCRLRAIVTPQQFIYFYPNIHKNKRIFQELFAIPSTYEQFLPGSSPSPALWPDPAGVDSP